MRGLLDVMMEYVELWIYVEKLERRSTGAGKRAG